MDLVSFESSLDAPTPPSGLGPAIKEKPRPKPGLSKCDTCVRFTNRKFSDLVKRSPRGRQKLPMGRICGLRRRAYHRRRS